jgi:hypothetical protein
VVKIVITYPFGNCLYHLSMVVWGMVYHSFANITFVLNGATPQTPAVLPLSALLP